MRVPVAVVFTIFSTLLAGCSRLGVASERATSEPHVDGTSVSSSERSAEPAEQAMNATAGSTPTSTGRTGRPEVVVELFSSEGCSSCPPADEVLRELSREPGVLALEMHVDYWNDLGWADPFSSRTFTDRQRAYATHLAKSGIYTPQAVVDGRDELVGSDARKLRALVAEAKQRPHTALVLTREGEHLTVETPARSDGARLFLATRESGLSTRVPRGENAGKTLVHGPIARALEPLEPKLERRGEKDREKDTWVAHATKSKRASTDYVALLVLPSMQIVGAANVE